MFMSSITTVRRSHLRHSIVTNPTGVEAIIRNCKILLDEKWSMHQARLPGALGIEWASTQNDVNACDQPANHLT